jgi:hypothetical protein
MRQRQRVLIVLATMAVALIGAAGMAAAGGGTAIGSAVPGGFLDPTETPTETPTATPSGTPSEPPVCTECLCPAEITPTSLPTTIENAAGRLDRTVHLAAAPVETPVEYTFTVKTDKDGKIIALDRDKDVKAKPAHMRDDINNEVAEDYPHGCYRLRFDSPTVLRCTASGSVNGSAVTVTVQLDPQRDPEGGRYNRFFFNFNPRVKNATFTITASCVGLN